MQEETQQIAYEFDENAARNFIYLPGDALRRRVGYEWTPDGPVMEVTRHYSVDPEGDGNPFTVFEIRVRDGDHSWMISRRFSAFDEFREALVYRYAGYPPPLPGKTMFWEDNKSQDFLEKRRAGLNEFLSKIARESIYRRSPELASFVDAPRPQRVARSSNQSSGRGPSRRPIHENHKPTSYPPGPGAPPPPGSMLPQLMSVPPPQGYQTLPVSLRLRNGDEVFLHALYESLSNKVERLRTFSFQLHSSSPEICLELFDRGRKERESDLLEMKAELATMEQVMEEPFVRGDGLMEAHLNNVMHSVRCGVAWAAGIEEWTLKSITASPDVTATDGRHRSSFPVTMRVPTSSPGDGLPQSYPFSPPPTEGQAKREAVEPGLRGEEAGRSAGDQNRTRGVVADGDMMAIYPSSGGLVGSESADSEERNVQLLREWEARLDGITADVLSMPDKDDARGIVNQFRMEVTSSGRDDFVRFGLENRYRQLLRALEELDASLDTTSQPSSDTLSFCTDLETRVFAVVAELRDGNSQDETKRIEARARELEQEIKVFRQKIVVDMEKKVMGVAEGEGVLNRLDDLRENLADLTYAAGKSTSHMSAPGDNGTGFFSSVLNPKSHTTNFSTDMNGPEDEESDMFGL
mmetsp:Transcript_8607/g.24282  ORF Transcript_8607/g.24282 Transcript_8607/m.24282 type:complete len:635 (+) Transcript_8607:293-2197(+)|eukprot:CAMPEP_0119151290 /NCGR_PEP_ID=MMETSP1310-20130426/46134_1 /TAXON_ID=464262 /ORGANISM="Genus nov. species nov., Strain RCC2339" /LENGTH=634 /DNA_ID=CAMNT_0007143557 /DNA_START=279 /DNA_END=2183 /DNA_ORIENTATION=+